VKKRYILLILCVAIVSGFILLNTSYFYNPLTFEKDHITYLEWDWYKKPLVLEYSVLENEEGWKIFKINDQKEVKFVFNQLKKSPFIHDEEFESSDGIRELVIRSNSGGIVLRVRQKSDNTFQVKNNTPNLYIDLTEDLMELLDKRFNQARNMD
jgi:hypothetical protein